MGTAAVRPEVPQRAVAPMVFLSATLVLLAIPAARLWEKQPAGLAVRPAQAQLRITWNRDAARKGNLEIVDGADKAVLPTAPNLASVTYQPESADVQVRLGRGGANEPVEIARWMGPDTESLNGVARDIERTLSDVLALRLAIARQTQRIEQMQRAADRMLSQTPGHLSKPQPPTGRWWRD